jgi:hypothetical protein
MPAFTVQTLIDRAAAIADMHDGFVTPTQWIAWLNTESRALELFVARSGWIEPQASTVDAASFIITIPSPLAILGVYEVRDNRYRPLRYKPQVDFTQQLYSSPGDTGTASSYTIMSNTADDNLTVHMSPKPTSGTYRALYLAGATPVTALTDSVRWPLGFEERLVLGMAHKALVRENSDTSQVEKLIGVQDQTIEEFCWSRQLAEAPIVRNSDRNQRGWSDYMIYGPYESWLWL